MDCCEKLKTFCPDWNGTLALDAEDSAGISFYSFGTFDHNLALGWQEVFLHLWKVLEFGQLVVFERPLVLILANFVFDGILLYA